jgi:hypothetical protein
MTAPPSRLRSALANGAKLTAAMVAAWVIATSVAWGISGAKEALKVTIAAVLCLTPGWLVFAFAGLYGTAAPLGTVIVGAVARMVAALVGALVVKAVRPDLGNLSFAVWLGVFYVLALAIETRLLLTPRPRGGSPTE